MSEDAKPDANKAGITLGAPKGGITLGGAAKGGIVLGGAAKGGVTLGGAPKGGVTLGGAPKGGITLGGAAKGGITLGGAAKGGIVLGGAKPDVAPESGAAEAAEAEAKKKNNKKKKKKAAEPADAEAKPDAKPDAEAKPEANAEAKAEAKPEEGKAEGKAKAKGKAKGGAKAKMIEQIRLQKEAEERAKIEEEERIKREEEEEKRRLEEEERQRVAKAEAKQRAKERAVILEKERKEREAKASVMANLAKFGSGVKVKALEKPGEAGEQAEKPKEQKPKKPVYGKKKPKAKTDAKEVSEVKPKPVEAKVEAVPESWDAEEPKESWEDAAKEAKPEAKPEVKPEAKQDVQESWDAGADDWEKLAESDSPLASSSETASSLSGSDSGAQASSSPSSTAAATGSPAASPASASPASVSPAVTPAASPAPAQEQLRSPICCVLGHVDTGKTKLLDKIRHTHVQDGEAGGITQQIGASYFPMETIKKMTATLPESNKLKFLVPGLLIIDTPGHESFTNLRKRGSSICDIAILVVDLMHGLEPQTIESIKLLRARKTPFVVALNKVDRLYNWKVCPDEGFRKAIKQQRKEVQLEFERRTNEVIVQFAEQELNACLFYNNKDFRTYVSLVPTSAISGEGIPDLLMLLVQLTQKYFSRQLKLHEETEATILEVKIIDGFGTTIDVILSQGSLRRGDTIAVCTLNGPVITRIRALLTPPPLREMRVKSHYIQHEEIRAAQGIKLAADDLDSTVPGSQLIVVKPGDDIDAIKEEVMKDLKGALMNTNRVEHGVFVQASTLGSLEALLIFLNESKIPVTGVNLGPVAKKHIMQASTMLEKKPEFAVILAFDVKVLKEAQEVAAHMGVTIFTAEIIYHLFDKFTEYMDNIKSKQKASAKDDAVFPVVLNILPEFIFNKRDPIVVGVTVKQGTLRLGTPIAIVPKEGEPFEIGRVMSIEYEHKEMQKADAGMDVAVKIQSAPGAQSYAYGRHFTEEDMLYSKISRHSIDALKNFFRDEISQEDVKLLAHLKTVFKVV